MFINNILKISKTVLINFIILLSIIIFLEIFLGTWFKNNFKYKLSSERNINRIYKFDFDYHKGTSHYVRNSDGFRVKDDNFDPSLIEIVFVGGSTINQKFINFDKTIVGIISNKSKNFKIANSGVDGMSIKGHINSFEFWFDKIKNFNPKYFIYVIGINDRYLVENLSFRDHVDNLEESSLKGNIREYLESNSFFYKQARYLKSLLFLKYNLEIGTNRVKRNHVYLERNKKEFISYKDRENAFDKLNFEEKDKYLKFEIWYLNQLEQLTSKVKQKGAEPIFITQTTGYGHSFESFFVAKTIMKHCSNKILVCVNVAKDLNLKYEDFYDESHLNRSGSQKFADFIYKKLKIF
tara:strand:+ start:366 stop:1418 length:1053 start_codon:yes stop_codon:yes gene_type:complete